MCQCEKGRKESYADHTSSRGNEPYQQEIDSPPQPSAIANKNIPNQPPVVRKQNERPLTLSGKFVEDKQFWKTRII